MKNILRNILLASVAVATVALVSQTAQAESRLTVPFSFIVNGKVCPAGQYSVQKESFGNLVRLRNQDASRSFTWQLTPGDPNPGSTAVMLKFDTLDENHALRSIQYGGLITSRLDKQYKGNERTVVVTGSGN